MDTKTKGGCVRLFYALFVLGAMTIWQVGSAGESASGPSAGINRLIVKLRDRPGAGAAAMATAKRLSAPGLALGQIRRMSGGAEILALPGGMTPGEAQAVAEQLMQNPDVEFAEPDRWVEPAMVPTDPQYPYQWYLHDATSEVAAASLPNAWALEAGAPSIVVAVVDSGILSHEDLDVGRVLPGYDFISDLYIANDGDGRDANPADPGNWVTATDASAYPAMCGSSARDSSWHGTHVAGIIAATGDNGLGIAGINWGSKLLPVRVLGKCGGYLSDVLDGLRWAAGVSDPYLPANSNPARVINLSLGSVAACGPATQSAVNDALKRGAVVVAAAGNNFSGSAGAADAGAITPGNCAGVVTVGALDYWGSQARYSRTGANVTLSTPGLAQSLFNTGDTVPDADAYAYLQGTSMSAASVSGVASLMLSLNPALTPEQVRSKLQASARAFPDGSTCAPGVCGAGMLDAARAVRSAMANAGLDQQVPPGATVTLSGAGSVAVAPASIVSYEWAQTGGAPVLFSGGSITDRVFTAPVDAQILTFELTVTDDTGMTASDSVSVRVVSPVSFSSSSTTGGGSVSGGGGGCFIATAAYGTAEAADVVHLRRFRDRYLMTNVIGRAFVATYYKLSPPFADAIRPHPLLRKLIRIGLMPYVALARWFRDGSAASVAAARDGSR